MSDWAQMRLRDLCQSIDYGLTASATNDPVGPKFLRITDIVRTRLDWSTVPFVAASPLDAEKYRLRTKDIVVARTGATTGHSAWISEPPDSVFASYLIRLRIKEDFDSRYVGYLLRSNQFRDYVKGVVGDKSAQPNASATTLTAAPLTVSTRISVQQGIAAGLGALDDKITANESASRTARQLMTFHYAMAVAEGSVTTTVGDASEVFDGPHATPQKTVAGPWFLSISSLQSGRLDLAESAHLGEQDFGRWTRRVTPTAGDVLFSYETRLGEAALMPRHVRACLGRRMALLRPRTHVVGSRTLLQAYLSESFQETIRQRSVHGATVDRIPLIELPAWPVVIPESADRIEVQLSALDEMANQQERENETLAALRDALLPKLMSGEIRVRHAEKVVEEAL